MPTPLTPSARSASNKALSELLPHLRGLSLAAQDAHWRVRGPMFGSLHGLFGELYAFTGTYADAVAERIAQFFGDIPRDVRLIASPLSIDGAKLCQELGALLLSVGAKAYETMTTLEAVDPVFHARLQDLQAQLEKLSWQVEAHIT